MTDFEKKASEIVNKLFYVPAFRADNLDEVVDNDERVDVISTALKQVSEKAMEKAIEECAKLAEFEYVNRQNSPEDDQYVNGLFDAQESISKTIRSLLTKEESSHDKK